MSELQEKHRAGRQQADDPDRAPTGPAYQYVAEQQKQQQQTAAAQRQQDARQKQQEIDEIQALRKQVREQVDNNNDGDDNVDENDDDEYDYLLDDDDDLDGGNDPVLEEIRQRRLAELKRQQTRRAENIAKGHGEVRTIRQDEFLAECLGGGSDIDEGDNDEAVNTNNNYVAVHFYHDEFERCKIMDHHLKLVAPKHVECKFVRIDAAKAPFFVAKLQVRTLPCLIVFRNGKAVKRLTGFEGLASDFENDPDTWETDRLRTWLAGTGAIKYAPPAIRSREDMQTEMARLGLRPSVYRGTIMGEYNDDDE